jgi:hypothetical protein
MFKGKSRRRDIEISLQSMRKNKQFPCLSVFSSSWKKRLFLFCVISLLSKRIQAYDEGPGTLKTNIRNVRSQLKRCISVTSEINFCDHHADSLNNGLNIYFPVHSRSTEVHRRSSLTPSQCEIRPSTALASHNDNLPLAAEDTVVYTRLQTRLFPHLKF